MRHQTYKITLLLVILTVIGTACQQGQPTPQSQPPTATIETAVHQPTAPPPQIDASPTLQPSPTVTGRAVTATSTPAAATATPLPAFTATFTPEPTATPAPVPTLSRTLLLQTPRLQGDDVLLLQQRLVELGYTEVGEPDGVFGPMTQTAVISFQSDTGLTADGVVGPQTWAALWGATVEPVAAGPTQTSEYSITRMVNAPNSPIIYMSYDGEALWLAVPGDTLYQIDPVSGKQLSKHRIGCNVCFGACELFAAVRDGSKFWALQYGSLKDQDCNGDEPWKYVGYMLRMTEPGEESSNVLNVTTYLTYASAPNEATLAVNGNTIWLGVDTAIYVIDVDQSGDDGVVMLKTIYPGINVSALLFADGKMWAGGEALVTIDPDTYQILGTYGLAANALAFDGERIWGALEFVQGMDVITYELTAPIPLPDFPVAMAFDGKNLWVAFAYSSEMAVIEIE